MRQIDMNNIRLQYKGYEISLAQHLIDGSIRTEEIAVLVDGNWEIVYYPAPNDADDYIVGIQAAKKYIEHIDAGEYNQMPSLTGNIWAMPKRKGEE